MWQFPISQVEKKGLRCDNLAEYKLNEIKNNNKIK